MEYYTTFEKEEIYLIDGEEIIKNPDEEFKLFFNFLNLSFHPLRK